MTYDADRSGTIDPREFQQALGSFGFRLQPATLHVLVGRYSDNGHIKFDDFVACCVKIRALTGERVVLLHRLILKSVIPNTSSSVT